MSKLVGRVIGVGIAGWLALTAEKRTHPQESRVEWVWETTKTPPRVTMAAGYTPTEYTFRIAAEPKR